MNPKIKQLNKPISVTLRVQSVYEWLCQEIQRCGGIYTAPPHRQLCRQFDCSRESFRRAILILVEIGLICQSGRSCFTLPDDVGILPQVEPEIVVLDKVPEQSVGEKPVVAEQEVVVLDKVPQSGQQETENLPAEISEEEVVPIEYHGERRLFDNDVAKIYGVSTKALNQAYKRHADEFEEGWVVQMSYAEWRTWSQPVSDPTSRSQSVTGLSTDKFRVEPPFLFNREGTNRAAFLFPQLPKPKQCARTIINVFTDFDRMAHGEEPKQENFKKGVIMVADRAGGRDELYHEILLRQDRSMERQERSMELFQQSMIDTRELIADAFNKTNEKLDDFGDDLEKVKEEVQVIQNDHAQEKQKEVEERAKKAKEKEKEKEKNIEESEARNKKIQRRMNNALRVAGRLETGIMNKGFFKYPAVYAEFLSRAEFRVDEITEENAEIAYVVVAGIVVDRAMRYPDRIQLLSAKERVCYDACVSHLARVNTTGNTSQREPSKKKYV